MEHVSSESSHDVGSRHHGQCTLSTVPRGRNDIEVTFSFGYGGAINSFYVLQCARAQALVGCTNRAVSDRAVSNRAVSTRTLLCCASLVVIVCLHLKVSSASEP
jgi:hypothetical protein